MYSWSSLIERTYEDYPSTLASTSNLQNHSPAAAVVNSQTHSEPPQYDSDDPARKAENHCTRPGPSRRACRNCDRSRSYAAFEKAVVVRTSGACPCVAVAAGAAVDVVAPGSRNRRVEVADEDVDVDGRGGGRLSRTGPLVWTPLAAAEAATWEVVVGDPVLRVCGRSIGPNSSCRNSA